MPIALDPDQIATAIARLAEHDLGARGDIESALEWVARREDPGDPALISRYELQEFLWYGLPRKWLIPPAEQRRVANRLGRFFELIGGEAAAYGALCSAEPTHELIEAWDEDADAAHERFVAALEASGLEPPDTEALQWGAIMGVEEAGLRRAVEIELEAALEQGKLDPVARNFKRRQKELTAELVRRPRDELGGKSAAEVIGAERLERWADGRSEERRALLAPVAPLLRDGAPAGESEAAVPEPLLWLLGQARDGIGLTQTGALNRACVRAAVKRFPEWWDTEAVGPPYREDEVILLGELHELARRARLLRRQGRRLVLTKRGESVLSDPPGLLAAIAPHLFEAVDFRGAVQELMAAALLANDETVAELGAIERRVHAAIIAEGWHAGGSSPSLDEVGWASSSLVHLAEALGILSRKVEWDHEAERLRIEVGLAPAGREALRLALRAGAVAPGRWL